MLLCFIIFQMNFRERAIKIINEIGENKRKKSNDEKPFFMYLAFQVFHL